VVPSRDRREGSTDTLDAQSHKIGGDENNGICDRVQTLTLSSFKWFIRKRTKLWSQATIARPKTSDDLRQDDEISGDQWGRAIDGGDGSTKDG